MARIRSIGRRAAEQGLVPAEAPRVVDPAERALALRTEQLVQALGTDALTGVASRAASCSGSNQGDNARANSAATQ